MQRKAFVFTMILGFGGMLLLAFLLLCPPQLGRAQSFFVGPPRPNRPQAQDMGVWTWTLPGYARPGGVVVYGIAYSNDGDTIAENVALTDTLPLSTTYAGDTSGFTHTIGVGGVITWELGDVDPGEWGVFVLTLDVDAAVPPGSGALSFNCVAISPGGANPGNDANCSDAMDVSDDEVEVSVDVGPSPSDPNPGQTFDYTIQWCNNRGAHAGPAWMTDTLPISTTVLSWSFSNPPFWNEITRTESTIEFYAPGLAGDMCQEIYLRLLLDEDAPVNTTLENTVVIDIAGDVDLDNNQFTNRDARVAGERYDVELAKRSTSGSLYPGGFVEYRLDYWNSGNMPAHVWLTDTLPAGTSYAVGSAWGDNGLPMTPTEVTEDYVMWDLGMLDVNAGEGFIFSAIVSDTVAVGTQLTNCAIIAADGPDYNDYGNTACAVETIQAAGPNLRVSKTYQWNGDGQLGYQLRFENLGNQAVNNVIVTDTLPPGTTWDGGWSTSFDMGFITTEPQDNYVLTWTISTLSPADVGVLFFNANLDDPSIVPAWYTNTAEITLPSGDVTPNDNAVEVVATRREVEHVDVWVDMNDAPIWGVAVPGPVTVTTPYAQFTAMADPGCSGCWNIGGVGELWPGDLITVEAGAATQPIFIPIPDPFSAVADAETDQVAGDVAGAGGQSLEIHGNWPGAYQIAAIDAGGHYIATYADVPPAANGQVIYRTVIDDCDVGLHHGIESYEIVMNVNYGHDWIEGNYESGHTLWITVTDSGGTVKGAAELTTGEVPDWDGQTGFSTNWQGWSGGHPDIAAGDWVYASMDNGETTAVRVGTIIGTVDVVNDSVSGSVDVPWLSGMLNAQCGVWMPGGPGHDFSVDANGGTYACDFSGEWDVQPGQDIGVQYQDPSGNWIINVFHGPAPRLWINTWNDGTPSVGGNTRFYVAYQNQGDLTAEDTVITATLEGATYLNDTSGFPVSGSGSQVSWDLGSVDPSDNQIEFYLFVQVTAGEGDTLTNTVNIATSNPNDMGGPGEKESTWTGTVQANDTHLNIGAGTWTWNPAPGTEYVYNFNVCNYGSTASSEVALTATLPLSTSLVGWWGQNAGWTEVLSAPQTLAVTYPALDGCNEVYARVALDEAAWPGMELFASAVITAANDLEGDDNYSQVQHNVGEPYTNLFINLWWNRGQLVPGGELYYNANAGNDGNLPITTTFPITFTLPEGTSYADAWTHTPQGADPFTPTLITANYVVWEIDGLDNGYNINFEVMLDVDPFALPGTSLRTMAAIGPHPDEDYLDDNVSTWTEQLYAAGPNLRVRKFGWWNDWGEDTRRLSYNVRVENIGSTRVEDVALSDIYPSETIMDSGMDLEWWRVSDWGEDGGAHLITVTYTVLDPGESTHLNFDTIVPGSDPLPWGMVLTNTAEVTLPPGDVNPDDNEATAVLFTGPDLFVEKTLVDGELGAGELLTFSLRFGNAQNGVPSWDMPTGAWLTDTLPVGMDLISATLRNCGPQMWCEYMPDASDGQDIGWDIWTLHVSEWNEFYVTVRVTDTMDVHDVFTNEVAITPAEAITEPFTANNYDSLTLALDLPNFNVGKVYASSGVAGTPVVYTLTVTNSGAVAGTNVILSDTIPSGLTDVGGGTLQLPFIWWHIASIAPDGGTAHAELTGNLPCAGTIVNDDYRVVSSDQGVGSEVGAPVSFDVIAPTITVDFTSSATTVVAGASIAVTGTAGSNGPVFVARVWDFGDDTTASGLQASHAYDEEGEFIVSLTVTDTCGYSESVTDTITVVAPTIVAGIDQSATDVAIGANVAFSDTSTTDGGAITAWSWDFGDESAIATTQNASHAFNSEGTFTVTLTVSDSLGYSDSATTIVNVSAPTIVASFDQSATSIVVGASVTFSDTSTTDGPPISAWSWDFGDDSTLVTTQNASHTFNSAGTFTVTLTVSDTLGYSDSAMATVTVATDVYDIFLPLVMRNSQ